MLAESETLGRPLILHSLGNYGVGEVEMVDLLTSIEKKEPQQRFIVKRPLNRRDSPGLRAEESAHRDFLLLKDIRPEGACKAPAVSCWSEKVERFKQIAYSRHGVDTNRLALVSDGPVKLLHVADEHTFSDSIYEVGEFDALNK